jgi:two-component system NtrC family sensor kinase
MKRKDGGTFQAAWSAASIVDGSGRMHVVAVIRDQTEEVRMREHLVRGERQAAIGELVSGVAHEMNNPLQSVIGTIELLLGEQHDARVREDLERARQEAGRAGRIVRNLLAFVRRSPAERLLADINEIVQSTVSVRAYELGQANIELREEYGPNLPVVLVNRDEIQQVILNLVINAQHAMVDANGGGLLTVRTRTNGDQAVVEVADNGPGISPEFAGRVFEPFFTTKTVGTGTGLGLSLAFGIAQAHGGSLQLVATNCGACFRLTLPGAGFPGPVHVH